MNGDTNSTQSSIGVMNLCRFIYSVTAYCGLHIWKNLNLRVFTNITNYKLEWNKKFFHIHHHYLINMNKVKEFQRHDGGYVIMENNKELEVSQRRRKDFWDAIHDFVV